MANITDLPETVLREIIEMKERHAYAAGLFDGEGSVSIVRNKANSRSDYHKVVVHVSQRAKHRQVLDDLCDVFGGTVIVRAERTRVARNWSDQAHWQLQSKPDIEYFLEAILPYLRIKAEQARLGLEFVRTFKAAAFAERGVYGRVAGKVFDADEIERREVLRLRMRALNVTGRQKQIESQLPPLDLTERRARESAG